MSEISDIAMIEQAEIGRIQPKVEQKSTTNALFESAEATTLKRLRKLAFEKAGKALMFSVDKVPLAASATSFLVSFGCGNVERQPPPPSPTPAVSEMPTRMPSATAVSEHLVITTPEPPSISTPTIPPRPTGEIPSDSSKPPQQEQSERKELIPYSPSITIIDAAPSVPTEGLIQKEFISNEDMIRNMLGDKYVSKEQLIQEFGQNYTDKWGEVVGKYPQALTYRLVDLYFGHGENVARVAENTLESLSLQSTGINILPLQKIFDKDSIAFIKDASGNPGVSLNFDQKRIIKLLENDQSRVVNGSFQVGNVELFQETKVKTEVIPKYDPNDPRFSGGLSSSDGQMYYPGAVGIRANKDGSIDYLDSEGKKVPAMSNEEYERMKLENSEVKEHKSTELKIQGAYTKEKTMGNLPKLFEVCNAYPDKFFVFAGGNSGEDFREAMETLKDKAPKNLLIVGEWIKYDYGMGVYEGPAMEYGKYGQVLGPDIYVYNEGSNHPHGSSFSTPEISAEIEILLNKGLSMDQAKAKVLASSDIHTLQLVDGTQYTAKVFNPSKIREK